MKPSELNNLMVVAMNICRCDALNYSQYLKITEIPFFYQHSGGFSLTYKVKSSNITFILYDI